MWSNEAEYPTPMLGVLRGRILAWE